MVGCYANDIKVSKAGMALVYLELIVLWGRDHKSDHHITVLVKSAINVMKERYGDGAMKVDNRGN